MTCRLIVTRHAKSSWATTGLGDHARPLNARGRRSASALGDWLAGKGHRPDHVLSSDARRTRETWAGIAEHLDPAPEVAWRPDLYHAGPGTMLKAVRGAPSGVILLLGHNPGIAQFAKAMLSAAPDHPRFHDYPTGATLVAEFEAGTWAEVAPGGGRVVDFVVPRDLID